MKIKNTYKIISIVIIAVVFSTAGYFFAKRQTASGQDNQKMLQEVVDEVSKLMVLPEDETPTLATVTDIKKLEGQPFFARAEEGDKILIYTNNKKVILYSTRLNKILEVGGVNLNGQQP